MGRVYVLGVFEIRTLLAQENNMQMRGCAQFFYCSKVDDVSRLSYGFHLRTSRDKARHYYLKFSRSEADTYRHVISDCPNMHIYSVVTVHKGHGVQGLCVSCRQLAGYLIDSGICRI